MLNVVRDERALAAAYLDDALWTALAEMGSEECTKLLYAVNTLDTATLGHMLRNAAREAHSYTTGEQLCKHAQ